MSISSLRVWPVDSRMRLVIFDLISKINFSICSALKPLTTPVILREIICAKIVLSSCRGKSDREILSKGLSSDKEFNRKSTWSKLHRVIMIMNCLQLLLIYKILNVVDRGRHLDVFIQWILVHVKIFIVLLF